MLNCGNKCFIYKLFISFHGKENFKGFNLIKTENCQNNQITSTVKETQLD